MEEHCSRFRAKSGKSLQKIGIAEEMLSRNKIDCYDECPTPQGIMGKKVFARV